MYAFCRLFRSSQRWGIGSQMSSGLFCSRTGPICQAAGWLGVSSAHSMLRETVISGLLDLAGSSAYLQGSPLVFHWGSEPREGVTCLSGHVTNSVAELEEEPNVSTSLGSPAAVCSPGTQAGAAWPGPCGAWSVSHMHTAGGPWCPHSPFTILFLLQLSLECCRRLTQ